MELRTNTSFLNMWFLFLFPLPRPFTYESELLIMSMIYHLWFGSNAPRIPLYGIPRKHSVSSVQFSPVAQSCLTLCDPMNRSTPGLPVHHQLLEFTQTHVHRVGNAIQPSHPLSSPSPPALNPSQHHSLFQWVNSSHEVAKVLEFQLEHHSFQRNPRANLLYYRLSKGLYYRQSKGLSRVFSNTTVQNHQFFGTQLSLQSNSHLHTLKYYNCSNLFTENTQHNLTSW